MSELLIDVKGVTKLYGRRLVLDRISVSVSKGEVFGIIGPSGCGKTTLLNIIMGSVRPEEGQVHVLGTSLFSAGASHKDLPMLTVATEWDEVKKLFGFAAQEPSFYPKLTVRENLYYFGSMYGLSTFALEANIKTLLSLLELEAHESAIAQNLSGGMQKRLDIGCALIHDPHILILDEPTADLDPKLRRQMWDVLKKVNRRGTTIIVSSHLLEEIETICDRIAIINKSGIVGMGLLRDVKKEFSRHEEIRLETSPGDYGRIITELRKNRLVLQVVEDTGRLHIRCRKAETLLPQLLRMLDRRKETVMDLKVRKASLNEIFEVLGDA
ncbi:hypothetical protein COY28_04920 [Candidatus Woesearchaeota archaeon CG_4_10_14_0_2_um_filter_57_5]|nr:MAG: hypothetical protein AUJ68_03900 [Candidatus Woesearchaeota archaeon CG1_02_57_44]PIN70900.1 MAG: hypothetical protein COV94_00695 [Candidatus Woesearchaeota archaeon CG11_big_fil_rev_8_21_14_0_20_57_5]PIZ51616.1 MAG: hypothetical protein COY28_04920 [Candidatus Woesearchaeota archaeon CG_4_10_14_0_2_um_filter_57_5]